VTFNEVRDLARSSPIFGDGIYDSDDDLILISGGCEFRRPTNDPFAPWSTCTWCHRKIGRGEALAGPPAGFECPGY